MDGCTPRPQITVGHLGAGIAARGIAVRGPRVAWDASVGRASTHRWRGGRALDGGPTSETRSGCGILPMRAGTAFALPLYKMTELPRMMKQARAAPERRLYPRHRVRVAVLWYRRRDQPEAAEICDISAEGIFLVATSALPDEVGIGDMARIEVRTDIGEGTLSGMVRWRGYHQAHGAIGCGIHLDEASRVVAKRLFPILRQPAVP